MRSMTCPCGSGRGYDACCGPFIKGDRTAPTAEALMRSRYSAYARHDLDYLWKTLHPRARKGHDPESTRDWSRSSRWLGLEILATEAGGADDSRGTVEFIARYHRDGTDQQHHEVSTFRKDDGKWFFEDGKVIGGQPEVRESPKVGRNDPCPCGSGKKYKKCCSQG